ncbi:MAG: hypothetical protein WA885_19300, partial [Phormidesmis sp.]
SRQALQYARFSLQLCVGYSHHTAPISLANFYFTALIPDKVYWAYVSGNSRLSCSMCVLASATDIKNGAEHNLSTWLELTLMEIQSGWSFQQGKWLSALPIDSAERLQANNRLLSILQTLGLVKRWNPTFAITLLSAVSGTEIVCWGRAVQLSLVEALKP